MILWDIIEEHLDEASFLWTQWERSLLSPRYVLREVMEGLEERLLAHVDGLRESGLPAVERLLVPALEEEEPGRLCVAAFTLLSTAPSAHLDALLGELGSASEVRRACMKRVLELVGGEALTARLVALLQEGRASEPILATALDALSVHPEIPGVELKPFLSSSDPLLHASALRASGRWQRPVAPTDVRRALDSPAAVVRDAALETGLLLGYRVAWSACQHFVTARLPGCGRAMLLLALGGQSQQGVQVLAQALASLELRGDALRALGASGWPEAVEACLPLLWEEQVGHLAGEAFSSITGLSLEDGFSRDAPEKDEDSPSDVSALELVPGVEEELPLPEPVAVEAWWKEERMRFMSGTRYFHGQPLTAALLVNALQYAPMWRRPALALDAAIRSRGEARLHTCSFARVQWEQVSRLRPDSVTRPTRPFADFITR